MRVCVCVCVCVYVCECMCVSVCMCVWVSMCVSTNVKISHSEPMSKNFRHIVISTHKNVEMSRAETVYFFPSRDT